MAREAKDKTPVEPKLKSGQLPMLAARPADISRLIRELESIDSALLDQGLRKTDQEVKLPKTSQLMSQIIDLNKLDLLQKADRQRLQEFLRTVKDRAPVLHMSFSTDPSAAFLEKLMTWLRREIHPQVLLGVGLQPTLGAGCIVRTTNRYFDFSLRQDFAAKHELLMSKLTPPPAKAKP